MKRLYRDRQNNMLAGVCSGLASYLDVDPVLVRVGFVLGAFANGVGLIAYLVLWVLVPQRPYSHDFYPEASVETDIEPPKKSTFQPAVVFGGILIAVGLLALLETVIPQIDLSDYWPVVLIALGIGLIVRNARVSRDTPVEPIEPAEPRSSQ